MDQDKSKTNNPLDEDSKKELAKAGRKLLDSSPGSGSFRTDIRQASMTLVESTGKIVDAITVVIGAIQEQNNQQKKNHEDERMMMSILESELKSTRSDNRTTRRLIWVSIIISCASVLTAIILIHQAQEIMAHQYESLDKTSSLMNQLYAVASSTKADQQNIKEIIEQKPTVAIRATDKKGSAAIEVKQPVVTDGKIDFDIVQIPLKMKGEAEVRVSDGQQPIKEKSNLAKDVLHRLQSKEALAK